MTNFISARAGTHFATKSFGISVNFIRKRIAQAPEIRCIGINSILIKCSEWIHIVFREAIIAIVEPSLQERIKPGSESGFRKNALKRKLYPELYAFLSGELLHSRLF